MLLKRWLKQKLPFTRKGLEDCLDERLREQQAELIQQIVQQISSDVAVQLYHMVNDPERGIIQRVRWQVGEALETHIPWRLNDLQAVLTEELMAQLDRRAPKAMLSFEVALSEHCNLNCAGCNHFSPLAPPSFLSLDEFTCDFRRIANLFEGRTQQVKLLGGEPLLNRDISRYLPVARECFPQAEIMIITNGLLLPQMDETFWETCKENRIVIAPTKYPVSFDYDAAEELAKAHNVEYRYFGDRTIIKVFGKYPMDVRGLQDCERNFGTCFVANSCIYLQHGRLYTCPIAPTAHYINDAFGTQLQESPHDSIDIYQAKSAEEILEFLARPIPFCRYCRRHDAVEVPWRQSKSELSEWV